LILKNEKIKTVLLYTAKNEYDLLLRTSILESHDVNFILKNYNSQDLFGIGNLTSGFFFSGRNPEIWVRQEDYQTAYVLIKTEE
jgi:hypothetical protein